MASASLGQSSICTLFEFHLQGLHEPRPPKPPLFLDDLVMQGLGAEEHHHHHPHHHHQQQQQQQQQQHHQHHLSRALMAESGATVVTAAEAEASKKNIADFLLHHSVYELLPESAKVQ